MYARLNRLYVLSVFVVCMSLSCTSGRLGDPAAGSLELSFEASELTRASVTTDDALKAQGFAVYGDMKFERDDERIPPTVIFNGTAVTYNDNKWSYTGTQYWFPRHEHSFVAVHPADAAGMYDTTYSGSQLSFKYKLPDDYKETRDLMVAAHRRKVPEDNPSYSADPVRFKFFHILSRVDFKVTNAGAADILKVTNITLEGVNKTGTFSIVPAPLLSGSGQTDDYDSSWSGISDKGTLTADINVEIPEFDNVEIPEYAARSLFPDDNALFVIPQPDNNSVIMKITYTLNEGGADIETLTLTAETPVGGWQPGKMYTYSLSVEETSKEIYLTVSVKPWQTPTGADVTVPES